MVWAFEGRFECQLGLGLALALRLELTVYFVYLFRVSGVSDVSNGSFEI